MDCIKKYHENDQYTLSLALCSVHSCRPTSVPLWCRVFTQCKVSSTLATKSTNQSTKSKSTFYAVEFLSPCSAGDKKSSVTKSRRC